MAWQLSATDVVSFFVGIVIADRMRWHQYIADVGSAPERVEAASIRTSLRRMSRAAIVVLDHENSHGATVFPDEEKEGSEAETTGSEQADGDDADHEVRTEDSKRSITDTMVALGNTIVICMCALVYPLAILPYYRAESTTE